MPNSTETFTCAGSFLRTEGFFNEVLLNSMSFACVPDCFFVVSEAHRFSSDTQA